MNVRPDAVVSGPPTFGVPSLSHNGNGARSRVVPSGTSHARLRCSRSIATSVPHGGRLHGAPHGDRNGTHEAAYGVPICGNSHSPLAMRASASLRGINVVIVATWLVLTSSSLCTGSTDALPQVMMPRLFGYVSVPCSDGGVYMPS